MITLQYILLHILLFVIVIVFAKKLSQCENKDYWKYCLPIIIFFTIEEGLRWCRDGDWIAYYFAYEQINDNFHNFEFLFYFLFKNCYLIGLPYTVFISLCSFMWIMSLCYFIQPYKEYSKFFLPICLLYFTIMVSNTFRWHLSMSFFLIGFRCLIENNTKRGLSFIICTLGIHSATFYLSLIAVLFFFIFNKTFILKPLIVVLISLLCIIIFQIDYFSNVINFFRIFTTERFNQYFDNAQRWFYSESDSDARKGTIEYIMLMMPFYIILFSSYNILKDTKISNGYLFYNLFVLLIMLRSLTSGVELLQRMSMYYEIFFIMMISVVFMHRYCLTRQLHSTLIIVVLFVMYKGYIGYFQPYSTEDLMKYIWNSELISPQNAHYYYKNRTYK